MIDWHDTAKFIKDDWQANPIRVVFETVNWGLNIAVCLTFTLTVPNVPFLIVYPMFFVCLTISMWSAISRGSFGLFMTSLTIFLVDLVGYGRLLSQ